MDKIFKLVNDFISGYEYSIECNTFNFATFCEWYGVKTSIGAEVLFKLMQDNTWQDKVYKTRWFTEGDVSVIPPWFTKYYAKRSIEPYIQGKVKILGKD